MSGQAVGYERAVARWRRVYSAAARRDKYQWILGQHGEDTGHPDAESRGCELTDALAEAVEMIASIRARVGQQDLAWFLAWQRYGMEPEVGLSVRYGPGPDVELFVDRLAILDLEELFEPRSGGYIIVRALHGKLTRATAKAIADDVERDLSFGGNEPEVSWEMSGMEVVIQVRV